MKPTKPPHGDIFAVLLKIIADLESKLTASGRQPQEILMERLKTLTIGLIAFVCIAVGLFQLSAIVDGIDGWPGIEALGTACWPTGLPAGFPIWYCPFGPIR